MVFLPLPNGNVPAQNFTEITRCVHDLSYFVQTKQSCKLQKPILANQDGIWKFRLIHLDRMTVEILSTDLHEFWTKSVGVVYIFCREWPHGMGQKFIIGLQWVCLHSLAVIGCIARKEKVPRKWISFHFAGTTCSLHFCIDNTLLDFGLKFFLRIPVRLLSPARNVYTFE